MGDTGSDSPAQVSCEGTGSQMQSFYLALWKKARGKSPGLELNKSRPETFSSFVFVSEPSL